MDIPFGRRAWQQGIAVPRAQVPAAAVWLLLALSACVPTRSGRPTGVPPDVPADRAFAAGSDRAEANLQAIFERLPETQGEARLRLGERILSYGEPSIPFLLKLIKREDESLRIFAAYLLGLQKDPRTFDALDLALADDRPGVRFEAATALIRGGDPRGASVLVDGLVHPDPRIRSRSIKVLHEATGETFGYRADDHPFERRAAVARWSAWLSSQRTSADR